MYDLDTAAYVLQEELRWLQRILQFRIQDRSTDIRRIPTLQPPSLPKGIDLGYGALVEEMGLDMEERLLLILTLAPIVAPQFLDREVLIWTKQLPGMSNGDSAAFWGLVHGQMYRGLLPTALLYIYIVAADQFAPRLYIKRKFAYKNYKLIEQGIILLSDVPVGEPEYSGILSLNKHYAQSLLL